MKARVRVVLVTTAGAVVLLLNTPPALAKNTGVHSPSGKTIYVPQRSFDEALDQNRRKWVIEAVMGDGPEGNVGLSLGRLNVLIHGFELYAGFGYALTPARHVTGSMRYLMNFHGFRPYLAAGYLWRNTFAIASHSHNVTGEFGYSWRIHHTYHLTAGLGARYIAATVVEATSPLKTSDADAVLLAEQSESMARWSPLAVLRFSRAF
jgi:hypothetical protein